MVRRLRPRLIAVFAVIAVSRMASAALCTNLSFNRLSMLSNAITVVTGDFNGDGNPDFAAATFGIEIFLGNGNGGFSRVTTLSTPSPIVRNMVVVDINGDGKADLITANESDNSISVFIGNGDGTFTLHGGTTFSTGLAGPREIAAGDINGDGKLDLAVANVNGTTISILFGDGAGGLTAQTPLSGFSNPSSVVLADLNRDGKLDLVAGNNSSSMLAFTGDGAGNFTNIFTSNGLTDSTASVAVADVNRDGRPDLIEVDLSANGVRVYLQQSNGTYSSATVPVYGTGASARRAVIGDFDGDGKIDLAVSNNAANSVSILRGNGDGTFAAAQNFGTDSQPVGIAFADFNRDGKPDLVVATQGAPFVSLLINTSTCRSNGCGLFGAASPTTLGAAANGVAIADFNRDGKLDAAFSFANEIDVIAGAGDGTFGSPGTPLTAASSAGALRVADINRDGKLDLVVVNGGDNSISVFLGNGDGTFNARTDFTVANTPLDIAIADFNRDGKPDIAVSCTSQHLTIMLNTTATGSSTPSFTITSISAGHGFPPRKLTAADFDRDGNPDLAVAVEGNGVVAGTVEIYTGSATGSFSFANAYATDVQAEVPVAGDFDRDGKIDLVVGNLGAATLSFLKGDGAGAFASAVNQPIDDVSQDAFAADLDGDGILDVVVAGGSELIVVHGAGDGSFANPAIYSGVTFPAFVAGGDLDRNGRIDLIAQPSEGSSVVALNACPDLSITKTHTGNFVQGKVDATFTITVSNAVNRAYSNGTVTVADTLPAGLTATSISGTNWQCTLGNPVSTCTRTDSLAPNQSFEPITLVTTVAHDAPSPVVNTADVSADKDADPTNNSASDSAVVDAGLSAPASLIATADSTSQVTVQWNTVPGAASYRIYRSSNHQPYQIVATVPSAAVATQSYPDTNLTGTTTYVYKVDAGGSSNDFSDTSNLDLATTIVFTGNLVPGTVIKAQHLIEIRDAVNAMLTAAGISTVTFADPAGAVVAPADVTDLRTLIDQARAAIGVPALTYQNLPASGGFINAVDFSELRDAAK